MPKGIIFFIIVLILSACDSKAPDREKHSNASVTTQKSSGSALKTPQETVERYNQLLAEGYKKLNMTSLQEVATSEQAEKAYVHMAAIGEGKMRMISQLKKLDFIYIDTSKPKQCRVTTREIWDFSYYNIQTGIKLEEEKDYVYHVAYVLEKRNGQWIITTISATGDERLAEKNKPRHIRAPR